MRGNRIQKLYLLRFRDRHVLFGIGFFHPIIENDNWMRSYEQIEGRFLLVALTFWALAMVVPDFYRLYQPLGSFGFYANNDGLITDVQGPFVEQTASPAFRAGLRVGDKLDLAQMRCIPIGTLGCASAMAALGGFRLVANQQRAELIMAPAPGRPARKVDIIANQRPYDGWVLAVLLLDQVAAILVILAAAWLVWTRPGIMTWGFFLYVIWFNPGQSAQYYALLQRYSPIALLTQNIAGAIAQGIGSAGFIWFALRAPNDETTSRWRPVELLLPFIAIALAGLLTLSYANLLGYPTEAITRAGVLSGIVVAACAFLILFRRTAGDHAWDNAARTLDLDDPMLERAHAHQPYDVADDAATRNDLPDGLMRPILAVPVGDRLRCLGLALYGPHATGNALSHDERSMLAELADKAASALMKLGDEQLRRRIAALESELESITAGLPTTVQRS